jgi:predicted patatin/cPLA2 family phospholipase
MFGWELLFDTLRNKLEPLDYDEFFRTCTPDNPDSTQYFIGVTNALTGEAECLVPHNKQQLLDYSKASCSFPYICPSVMITASIF